MVEFGYLGLFATAFLAATLIPVSSEVVLGALSKAEGFEIWLLVAVASAGNTLGSIVNWILGRYCLHWRDQRWFPIKPAMLTLATKRFHRYGLWSLLLAWLPIVGDPLTFAAGVLGVRLPIFVTLVAIGKVVRYITIAALAQHII
ncbi:MAG: YqaA family protein [Pseudomonadota bacterium]|nr:YqaA family protein [Pseudomonadota bacterium]